LFTAPKTALVLALLSLFSVSARADEFTDAVARSHQMNLTQVNTAQEGVPFYSKKTLDPVWELNGPQAIVKVDDFPFTDQEGKKQTEKIFDGKTTFVSFFFSSCAGICPMAFRNLMGVEKKIKEKFKNVQFVAISIDPERDNPAHLKKYKTKLHLSESWKLITGDKEKIYSLARDTFAAEAFKLPKTEGQFAHTEHFYVLDSQRRLRGVLKGTRLDVGEKASDLMTALSSDSKTKL
jgi:protein SCO1/2